MPAGSESNTSSSSSSDNLVTCGGLFVAGIIFHLLQDKWKRLRERAEADENKNGRGEADASENMSSGDHYHRVRYHTAIREQRNLAVHVGQCHCGKVQFKILAPRVIYAVDVPSKIRFPRVTVNYVDFELLNTDVTVLSMYTVQQPESGNIGIHSFCSFCGMQVLYAPSIDPIEVQINLDCLEAGTIEATHIAYHSSVESAPYPQNEEFNKRGDGYWTASSPTLHDLSVTGHRQHNTHHHHHHASPHSERFNTYEVPSIGTKPKTTYFFRVKVETATSPASETNTEPLYSSPINRIHLHSNHQMLREKVLTSSDKGFVNEHPDNDHDMMDTMSLGSIDSMDPRSYFDPRPPSSISMISDEDSSYYSQSGRYHRPHSFSGVSTLTDSNVTSPATASGSRKHYRHSISHSGRSGRSEGGSNTIDFSTYQQMKRHLHRHMSGGEASSMKTPSTPSISQSQRSSTQLKGSEITSSI